MYTHVIYDDLWHWLYKYVLNLQKNVTVIICNIETSKRETLVPCYIQCSSLALSTIAVVIGCYQNVNVVFVFVCFKATTGRALPNTIAHRVASNYMYGNVKHQDHMRATAEYFPSESNWINIGEFRQPHAANISPTYYFYARDDIYILSLQLRFRSRYCGDGWRYHTALKTC